MSGLVTDRDVEEAGLLWVSFLVILFVTHHGLHCRYWRPSFTDALSMSNVNCMS